MSSQGGGVCCRGRGSEISYYVCWLQLVSVARVSILLVCLSFLRFVFSLSGSVALVAFVFRVVAVGVHRMIRQFAILSFYHGRSLCVEVLACFVHFGLLVSCGGRWCLNLLIFRLCVQYLILPTLCGRFCAGGASFHFARLCFIGCHLRDGGFRL